MEEYEVTVDNRPETPEVLLQAVRWSPLRLSSIAVDMEEIKSYSDVFFPNGTCKENFESVYGVLCDCIVISIR